MPDRRADFATGRLVDLSRPEEVVRQEYEQVLVGDYGYPREHLDIEVAIPRGTGYFPDKADIVVYYAATGRDPASDIWGIVETKRPQRADGIAQLKSYMTATSAAWGVWTNGDDIAVVSRDAMGIGVLEDQIFNIPAYGQQMEDIGRIARPNLKPFGRQELKSAFRRILSTLYANTNISRREKLGAEMIKLIFAKIEDEKSYHNRPPAFRAQAGESNDQIKARIDKLFERVLNELKGDGIFSPHDEITLDSRSVAWVVGQLERGSLLETDTDVVGDAFEVFAESRLAGEKGEFFTPRGVIRLAVKIADPSPDQTVCDPACGSGGFLIHAMNHVWDKMDHDPQWRGSPQLPDEKRKMATRTIYGIDKETDLVKIAKAHMAIAGDGRSNVVHENSLHQARDFEGVARHHFVVRNSFRKFDFVLTNPPFGTKAKVLKEDSAHFVLGKKWSSPRGGDVDGRTWTQRSEIAKRDPYVLFVERCMDILEDGGTLAIVLPETVFHAPSLGYLRQFILGENNIRAIIDLPHNTFRPHCNAKTCLIVLQKRRAQQRDVLMVAAEEMGHDHNGRPLVRYGTDEVWDDLEVALTESDIADDPANTVAFTVPWSEIDPNCLVPRYYRGLRTPPAIEAGRQGVSLGELVDAGVIRVWDGHGSPPAVDKGQGPIPYIRVNDIVNWELYRNPVASVPVETFERMTRNKHLLEEGDVVFVRRGSYRIGTVAMASARDRSVLLTRELLTFRVVEKNNEYGITPYYLLALLASRPVQDQLESKTLIDTTLPTLGDRWRSLVLPVHTNSDEARRVSERIEEAIRSKWAAQAGIDQLSGELGDLTR